MKKEYNLKIKTPLWTGDIDKIVKCFNLPELLVL
jgi:hypothetical protein